MFKKKILVSSLSTMFLLSLSGGQSVFAQSSSDFLTEEDQYIELPGGGYIQGQATLWDGTDINDSKEIRKYDSYSEKDLKTISGAELSDKVNSESVDKLNGLKDDDVLIQLPDGGYLKGEATLWDNSNPEMPIKIAEYDSNNLTKKSKTITGKEYKEFLENPEKEKIKESRQTTPSSKHWDLNYKATYYSNAFGGKGWQYAGYFFEATNSSGSALRWESFNSTGYAGTGSETNQTYHTGKAKGSKLLPGESNGKYLNSSRTYYVKNPIKNTRYWVGNVD